MAPILALLAGRSSVVSGIAIVFISHMLVLYPTLRPGSQWLGPVATSFETSKKEVWLTIDDGPHPEDTLAILDLLDRYQAKATFFVKGTLLRSHRFAGEEIQRRGHGLGNHSSTHPSATFWCLPPGRITREIDECSAAIREVTGVETAWFRPPVGMKNPFVHPIAAKRGLALIGWSLRGFDGVGSDPGKVIERLTSEVFPGAILLMHEGRRDSSNRPVNVIAIEGVLEKLSQQGYAFVIPTREQLVHGRLKTRK